MGPGPNYIECSNLYYLSGFWFDGTSVSGPWRRDLSVSCIGDSITGGANEYAYDTGWLDVVCGGLGAQMRNYAIGGSGWFTGDDSKGQSTAFRNRIEIAASQNPDIHYWFGGWNDGARTAGEFYAEQMYCAKAFAAISPNTKQIIIGSHNVLNGGAANKALNTELKSAANDLGLKFIDLMTQFRQSEFASLSTPTGGDGRAYIDTNGIGRTASFPDGSTGSLGGKAESFVNANNASLMISGDNVHPTYLGAQNLGQFILAKTLNP